MPDMDCYLEELSDSSRMEEELLSVDGISIRAVHNAIKRARERDEVDGLAIGWSDMRPKE